MDDLKLTYPQSLRPSTMWLLSGQNLPHLATIGSNDCPASIHLNVANRFLTGKDRYTQVKRVIAGAIAIPEKMIGNKDQSFSGEGGQYYDIGQSKDPADKPKGTTIVPLEEYLEQSFIYTAVVKVDTERNSFLLAFPTRATSNYEVKTTPPSQLIDFLIEKVVGPFKVSRIDGGQFTLTGEPAHEMIGLIVTPDKI